MVTTCLDCNCALPPGDPANATDDHGDDRHITIEQLVRASTASGIEPAEAAKRIRNSADAWGEKWPGAYGLTAKQAAKQAAKKA